jgi:hypothetical protein
MSNTKSLARLAHLFLWVAVSTTAAVAAPAPDAEGYIALHYSDGTAPSVGIEAVNARLRTIGVRVSEVPIPDGAKPLLRAARDRALKPEETSELLGHFHLGRKELVQEIVRAGRSPEMPRGGHLQTSEAGVAPYPKVYDMKGLDGPTTAFIQRKFGRLHVNSSDAGVGIDEVMTIVSGGPYTWFFVLPQDVVGKLRFGRVGDRGLAWRISYPGLVPHGGFFDASDGLVVARAHGPSSFVMRYEDPSVDGAATLDDNPWIDFTRERPQLLSLPRKSKTLREGENSTTPGAAQGGAR